MQQRKITRPARNRPLARAALAAAPIVLFALSAAPAPAEAPAYRGFELLARNQVGFPFSYNLEFGWNLTDATPVLNDDGRVALRVVSPFRNQEGIWVGRSLAPRGLGRIVYHAPVGTHVSEPGLNNQAGGRVVFSQTGAEQNGLFRYDIAADEAGYLGAGPAGSIAWMAPRINDLGVTAFRAAFPTGDTIAGAGPGPGDFTTYVSERGVSPVSPYSSVSAPALNNAREVAATVAGLDTDHQEVRRFRADGTSVLIARDRAIDPASPYVTFSEAVALDDAGRVAFTATLAGGVKTLVLSGGSSSTVIAREGEWGVAAIVEAAPAVNDCGLVAFRGVDTRGLESVFVSDGASTRRVLSAGDAFESDLGPALIGRLPGQPGAVFAAGVALNGRGDVAFNVNLIDAIDTTRSYGAAVIVARAGLPADADGSGEVNANDLSTYLNLWFADTLRGTTAADFDSSGETNANDVSAFINAWQRAVTGGSGGPGC